MNKLSEKDKKKAMDALTKCAAATSAMTDADEVNRTIAGILKECNIDKPELIKRACESYNSAKSIYKLANATDDTRGDDFTLADSNAVLSYMTQSGANAFLSKAASAYGVGGKITFGRVITPIAKIASAPKKAEAAEPTPKAMSTTQLEAANKKLLGGIEKEVLKAITKQRIAKENKDSAEKTFKKAIAAAEPKQRKEASELLYAAYGNAIAPMLSETGWSKNRFKGSVALPATKLYKLASDVVETAALYKKACAIGDAVAGLTVDTVREMFESTKLRKTAGVPAAMVGSGLSRAMMDVLGFPASEDSKLRRDIMDADAINALREHGARRAFMEIVNDDTISKYDLKDVVAAYNEALKALPPNLRDEPATVESQLLKANVIARLTRGNVPSQADTDTVLEFHRALGDIKGVSSPLYQIGKSKEAGKSIG